MSVMCLSEVFAICLNETKFSFIIKLLSIDKYYQRKYTKVQNHIIHVFTAITDNKPITSCTL